MTDENAQNNEESGGKNTKAALIIAGMALFGEYGFKATTTRMLADRSGANVSAIPYYFGNKKGLYHAVVEHIASRVASHSKNMKSSLEALIENNEIDRDTAILALKKMVENNARLFVDTDEPQAWAQIIMREQASPTEAFDILYEAQLKPMQRMFARLISLCTGLAPDSDEVKIKCHAIFGQTLAFVVSRESILRSLGVKKFDDRHLQIIHETLMNHIEGCLDKGGGS